MELALVNDVGLDALNGFTTPWSEFDLENYKSSVPERLSTVRERLDSMVHHRGIWSYKDYRYFNVIIQEFQDWLKPIFSASSLHDSAELRSTIEAVEPLTLDFYFWITFHNNLYNRNKETLAYLDRDDIRSEDLSDVELKAFKSSLKISILNSEKMGINLANKRREELKRISLELQELMRKFGNNLLDSRVATTIDIFNEDDLEGIPSDIVEGARRTDGESGWKFKLDGSIVSTVMEEARLASTRERFYIAHSTLASKESSATSKFDNGPILLSILQKRGEMATILGDDSFAVHNLKGRSLNNPQMVFSFLKEMERRVLSNLDGELAQISAVAKKIDNKSHIETWDIAYYRRLALEEQVGLKSEEIRAYLPLQKVLCGLVEAVERLFSLKIRLRFYENGVDPRIRILECRELGGELVGHIFLDLFSRDGKAGGAWADCLGSIPDESRGRTKDSPVMLVSANYNTAGTEGEDTYLTHYELLTLFHEMGHALQGLLTVVELPGVSGLDGIPWDAVEIASQLLECWGWEPLVLKMASCHRTTKEAMPDDMIERLRASKKAFSASSLARQMIFSQFDMDLHDMQSTLYAELTESSIIDLYRSIHNKYYPTLPQKTYARTPHQFSHIFDGSYAAGYYGYLFSKSLSCDFFSLFEDANDPFDPTLTTKLRQGLFDRGSIEDCIEQFREFSGRDYNVASLMRWYGLDS